ncbi:glycosyltransferase family 4 protein [Belnapia sp. T18]|uniref:Glycosyltransferase family 4 protein n=1 Tax=Belnapia arida TaxID=2804533 RepID=A0ABS1TXF1_9PROT|nr:glycosyltransferase family 1 protein [Belnapia arida]MBL6076905.1 glycosyltransferase family 4 protein [Belnapia arida]
MAYAKRWLFESPASCDFAAQSGWGWFGLVPRRLVAALVEALELTWLRGPEAEGALTRARRIAAGLHARLAVGGGRAALQARLEAHSHTVFLLVSHRSLESEAPIAALRRAGARFVPLIHDLIPLTHPEYSRSRQVARHAARVATTAALADGIIVNSSFTASTLLPQLARYGRAVPPLAVAPLGVDLPPTPPALLPPEPYFVCLGTIEPRKNHLLLLHVWREMADRARALPGTPPPPKLLVLGRRGWENENVVDLLERCDMLRGIVQEVGTPPDAEVSRLVANATALLFPSFVEGYGLPVAEALSLGTPVICSDTAPLREVGGTVPEFLDPLDGPAWIERIEAFATPDSAARAAQCARLRHWSRPQWAEHFEQVDALLDQVIGLPRPAAAPLPLPSREPSLA